MTFIWDSPGYIAVRSAPDLIDIWLNMAIWGLIWTVTALFLNRGVLLISVAIGLFVISMGMPSGVGMALRIVGIPCFLSGVYFVVTAVRNGRQNEMRGDQPELERSDRRGRRLLRRILSHLGKPRRS